MPGAAVPISSGRVPPVAIVPVGDPVGSAWEGGWLATPLWYLRTLLWVMVLRRRSWPGRCGGRRSCRPSAALPSWPSWNGRSGEPCGSPRSPPVSSGRPATSPCSGCSSPFGMWTRSGPRPPAPPVGSRPAPPWPSVPPSGGVWRRRPAASVNDSHLVHLLVGGALVCPGGGRARPAGAHRRPPGPAGSGPPPRPAVAHHLPVAHRGHRRRPLDPRPGRCGPLWIRSRGLRPAHRRRHGVGGGGHGLAGGPLGAAKSRAVAVAGGIRQPVPPLLDDAGAVAPGGRRSRGRDDPPARRRPGRVGPRPELHRRGVPAACSCRRRPLPPSTPRSPRSSVRRDLPATLDPGALQGLVDGWAAEHGVTGLSVAISVPGGGSWVGVTAWTSTAWCGCRRPTSTRCRSPSSSPPTSCLPRGRRRADRPR